MEVEIVAISKGSNTLVTVMRPNGKKKKYKYFKESDIWFPSESQIVKRANELLSRKKIDGKFVSVDNSGSSWPSSSQYNSEDVRIKLSLNSDSYLYPEMYTGPFSRFSKNDLEGSVETLIANIKNK